MLPNDPVILLSVVNTRLRDAYASLSELCAAEDVSAQELEQSLTALGCRYDAAQNQFVRC